MNCTERVKIKLRKLWRNQRGKKPALRARDTRPQYKRRLQRGRNSSKIDRGG